MKQDKYEYTVPHNGQGKIKLIAFNFVIVIVIGLNARVSYEYFRINKF